MNFEEALARFVVGAQAKIDAEWGANPSKAVLEVDPKGRQYIRLYTRIGDQRSCWCFIAKEDVETKQFSFRKGDVLKSDGWKTPAKHARGNIFDESGGLALVSAYGPSYLK